MKRIDFPAAQQEPALRQLWQAAFGDSQDFIGKFFETAYSPDRCRCVNLDGQVAAALYWLDAQYAGQKIAYLYAVATHPNCRNRGLCRELMEDVHTLLAGRGYAAAMLTPAEPALRRMYAGMGYEDCCTVSEIPCKAGKPVPLRKVRAEEYARLRRQYLPRGGVIQEGENLSYLESYAEFYAGADFLLAAAEEGESLRGLELLGNSQAGPGILGALGFRTGMFRMPGGEKGFSMFRPLKPGAERPAYFGLAFD